MTSIPFAPDVRRLPRAGSILGGLIVASTVIRSVVAWQHSTARLFPDEYIYAALGRSLGHGHLQIRGATAHFPGIFEPLVAAPIWRLFGLTTAYHLVQVENAVAASLAAIPVYVIARRLRLSTTYSLAAAAYALLVPELVIIAFTSSDAVAYPLALAAIATGIAALDQPSNRRQAAFLTLTALATLTRIEYAVLAPAYAIAALAVDRRQAHRRHSLAFALLVPGAVLAVVGAATYYPVEISGWLTRGYFEWLLLGPFLLALEIGVAAAPGALLGLTVSSDRRERVFAAFCGAFAICLLAAASRAASEKSEYKERYLFVLLALAPLACGLYLRSRPARARLAVGVAIVIAVAAARLPISGYSTATFKTDSQFLYATSDLLSRVGIGTGSLIVALAATAGAVVAGVIAFRGHYLIPLAVALAVALVTTVSAVDFDLRATRAVRAKDHDLRWVDHQAHGQVVAIQTPVAAGRDLLPVLYWNTSIQREYLLANALASDAFSAPKLRIAADGTLPQVGGDVLFHDFGTTGRLAGARRIASAAYFTLWRPVGPAKLRLVVQGRFYDGWLNPRGRIRAWALHPGARVRVSFRLSLPSSADREVRVSIAGGTWLVRPGSKVDITCNAGSRLDFRYTATGRTILQSDFRRITARMTRIVVQDGGRGQSSAPACRVSQAAHAVKEIS